MGYEHGGVSNYRPASGIRRHSWYCVVCGDETDTGIKYCEYHDHYAPHPFKPPSKFP